MAAVLARDLDEPRAKGEQPMTNEKIIRYQKCTFCNGKGSKEPSGQTCEVCKGTGQMPIYETKN